MPGDLTGLASRQWTDLDRDYARSVLRRRGE